MRILIKQLHPLVAVLVSLQFISCGTILYPERRSQNPGKLDVGIVLLDGFWLLVGIIPGVIAFAVDFSTGAIYLPASSAQAPQHYRTVYFDPVGTTPATLEAIISRETGRPFSFSDEDLEMTRVRKTDDVPVFLAKFDR
jgi:hypothetical protein